MGIEAFVEASAALMPGWAVRSVEDINFLAPFKFYRNEARSVRVEVQIHPEKDEVVADCRLVGVRTLPNQTEPQTTVHFTGQVRLTRAVLDHSSTAPFHVEGVNIEPADIYKVFFHGPAYQVIHRAFWNGQQLIGQFSTKLSANHHPPELETIASPRHIELCFQTVGLFELGTAARLGLPQHVREVRLLRDLKSSETDLYAVVTPDAQSKTFDAVVQDAKGNCYLRLTGYQTVELPGAVSTDNLKALRECFSGDTVLAA
jgi:hypothetical protein